jgi:hypothetical protein
MPLSNAPKLALVDPIRSSRVLIDEVKRRNVDFVVVESGLVGEIAEMVGCPVISAPTIDAMAEKVRKLGVTQIIGCVDPCILYADTLAAYVGLPSNGLRLSEARRHKGRMNDAIRKAGLRAPSYCEASKIEDLVAWLRSANYPVVIKPASSGGTDNVYRCDTEGQAVDFFHRIIHKRNLMGAINESVLAQEFIDGTEYVADCVTYGGNHVAIGFLEYQKGTHNGRAFIYEKEFYLRSDDPVSVRLYEFAKKALDALEFRTGASHMELKINSKNEIVFIEVGARIDGAENHKLFHDGRADAKSQVEYTIDCALGLPPPDPAFGSRNEAMRTWIIATEEGQLKEWRNLDEIKALRSYTRMHLNVQVGQTVKKTMDLSNDAGFVELAHPDLDVLRADEKRLDEILAAGVLVF